MTTPEREPETLPAWCARVGLSITCEPNPNPPPSTMGDRPWIADGWTCTLALEGRTLVTPYWCGTGHREWSPMETPRDGTKGASVQSQGLSSPYSAAHGWRHITDPKELPASIRPTLHNVAAILYRPTPPTAADVLYSLVSDAQGVKHGQTFEDWCADYGSDPDSRKAEATYRACQDIALRLRGFLGAHYDAAQTATEGY